MSEEFVTPKQVAARLCSIIGSDYVVCTNWPLHFVGMIAKWTRHSFRDFFAALGWSFNLYSPVTLGAAKSFNHFRLLAAYLPVSELPKIPGTQPRETN